MWYKKYEELIIFETGQALDLGAEVETYSVMEGASGDQDMDIPNSVDLTPQIITHRIATLARVTEGTEHHQRKLLTMHCLTPLKMDASISKTW